MFGMSSSSVDNYNRKRLPYRGLTAKQVVIEHMDSTCGVFETIRCTHCDLLGNETTVGYTSTNPVTTLSNVPVEDSNGDDLKCVKPRVPLMML